MNGQPQTSRHRFYYSSYYLARDGLSYLAPFSGFVLLLFYLMPQSKIFTAFEDSYKFATDSWAFNVILIVGIVLVGIVLGELSLRFILGIDKLIQKIGESLEKRSSGLIKKLGKAIGRYRSYDKIYEANKEQIDLIYENTIKGGHKALYLNDKEFSQKIDILVNFFQTLNPNGYIGIPRAYGRIGMLHQTATYLFLLFLLLLGDQASLTVCLTFFGLFILTMIVRHTFIYPVIEIEFEFITASAQIAEVLNGDSSRSNGLAAQGRPPKKADPSPNE